MIVSEDTIKLLLGLGESITAEEDAFVNVIHAKAEGAVKAYLHYDPEQQQHTEYYPRHLRSGGPGVAYDTGIYDIAGSSVQWQSNVSATTLQLLHIPLRYVTSVHVDSNAKHGSQSGAFAASTAYAEGTDFWAEWDQDYFCPSGQLLAFGGWSTEPGTIKVVYTAGHSAAEFAGNVTTETTDTTSLTFTQRCADASGIALAVQVTVIAAFKRAYSMRKQSFGFAAGPLASEKLGDYSYTLATNGVSNEGVAVALPDDAKEYLQPHVHYGLARL